MINPTFTSRAARCAIFSLTVILWPLASRTAVAGIVTLNPSRDNSLYENTDPNNQNSNGQGDLFAGRTGQPANSIRRGLVMFDVASNVPTGATITDVVLTMTDIQGMNGDIPISLHPALADWGEGSSYNNGGTGAPAADGDATWLYRFYNAADPPSSPAWATAGGVYDATASATTVVVDAFGPGHEFQWQDAPMVANVQDWLDHPSTNFGWFILGDESTASTAKRFGSGESATPPQLQITYSTVPEPCSLILLGMGLSLCVVGRRQRSRAWLPETLSN